MKKLISILMTFLLVSSLNIYADTEKAISVDQLPKQSVEFIKKHFSDQKIALAKSEKEFLITSYKVVLSNSTKLTFSREGDWLEIDCKYNSVSEAIIPKKIFSKIKELSRGWPRLNVDRQGGG